MIVFLFAALFFTAPVIANQDAPSLWTLEFKGEHPVAVFFDAASSSLFVSVRSAGGASGHIAKVSQAGKLENADFATSGEPLGALRAFDGRIFWIAGNQVFSKGRDGVRNEGSVAAELGDLCDIAVDRKGVVYVGTSAGYLVRIRGGVVSAEQKGQPVTGLFLYQDTLQLLRGTQLQSITVSARTDPQASSIPFCAKECRGLERTGTGKWLTVSGAQALEVGNGGSPRILYSAPASSPALGRPAYVYQMNSDDDFFVVPIPGESVIRAFRVNAARK